MTEFSEISDVNNSLNNSCLSCNDNNESSTNYISTIDKLNMKNYTIRCSNCSSIALLNADFKKNHFITICDNQHKNEYNKFTQFINETNKDLHLILCNECKKTNEEKNLFRCNQCYLFFCDKCKINHVEKSEHQNFIEFSKIDIVCPKHNQAYKYYNNEKKIHLCEACFNNLNNKKNIIKYSEFINKTISFPKKPESTIIIKKKNEKDLDEEPLFTKSNFNTKNNNISSQDNSTKLSVSTNIKTFGDKNTLDSNISNEINNKIIFNLEDNKYKKIKKYFKKKNYCKKYG